jgi:hypothetical protein
LVTLVVGFSEHTYDSFVLLKLPRLNWIGAKAKVTSRGKMVSFAKELDLIDTLGTSVDSDFTHVFGKSILRENRVAEYSNAT